MRRRSQEWQISAIKLIRYLQNDTLGTTKLQIASHFILDVSVRCGLVVLVGHVAAVDEQARLSALSLHHQTVPFVVAVAEGAAQYCVAVPYIVAEHHLGQNKRSDTLSNFYLIVGYYRTPIEYMTSCLFK